MFKELNRRLVLGIYWNMFKKLDRRHVLGKYGSMFKDLNRRRIYRNMFKELVQLEACFRNIWEYVQGFELDGRHVLRLYAEIFGGNLLGCYGNLLNHIC